MASRMNPRPSIPESRSVEVATTELRFQESAELGGVMAEAPLGPPPRKPLRGRKERPPVAEEIDAAQVRNPDLPTPAVPLAPLAPGTPSPNSPPPALMVDGLRDDDTAIPPDTMGAVGHDHLFNPLNNGVLISDRTGVPAVPVLRLNAFWSSLGIAPLEVFDPRAVYDPFNRRFLFTCTANAESPESRLLIGVSKGADPTGNWTLSSVKVDPQLQGNIWLDFPSIGFSADKITVQVNMYRIGDNVFQGSSVYVWDKASLYDPPFQPAVRLFVLEESGALQVPAVTYDPDESTQYLVSRWAGNISGNGSYAIFEITGNVADGSVSLAHTGFIQTTGTNWDSFFNGDFAPQRGTIQRIDVGDDRILSVVNRHGSLWFSHTVYLPAGGPDRTAAQWLEVDTGSWTIRQLGRVDDPEGMVFHAFPTLAVNADRDVLLGLGRFSADQFASGAYAFRAAGDRAGTMRTPFVYAPGANSYFKTFTGTANRWGDYSRTQVDPVDDRSFWTIQEFASETINLWATRWAQVS